jgi:hypothetical protein
VCVPYHRYVFFLKWLTLSLLSYAAVLFTVHVPWGEVALRTIWPNIKLDSATEKRCKVAIVLGSDAVRALPSPSVAFLHSTEQHTFLCHKL